MTGWGGGNASVNPRPSRDKQLPQNVRFHASSLKLRGYPRRLNAGKRRDAEQRRFSMTDREIAFQDNRGQIKLLLTILLK